MNSSLNVAMGADTLKKMKAERHIIHLNKSLP